VANTYRPLTEAEIKTLEDQGSRGCDWASVQVADGFQADRVFRTMFGENVKLGVNSGEVASGGIEKCCGIFDAFLHNCTIGDNVPHCQDRRPYRQLRHRRRRLHRKRRCAWKRNPARRLATASKSNRSTRAAGAR
jgi:hypothetical protein